MSVEWLAVGAMVVVLLGTIALQIAPNVGRAIASAFCEITAQIVDIECASAEPDVPDGIGSDLDGPNLPDYCVTGQSSRGAQASGGFKVFSLGAGWYGMMEHRSDGTVAVTTLREGRGGLSLSADTGLQIHTGENTYGIYGGASVGAELFGQFGTTYVLPNEDQANRFLRDQAWKDGATVAGNAGPIPIGGGAIARELTGGALGLYDRIRGRDPVDPVFESGGVELGVEGTAGADLTLAGMDPGIELALAESRAVSVDADGNITGTALIEGSALADSGLDMFGDAGAGGAVALSFTYSPSDGALTSMNIVTEHHTSTDESTTYNLNIPLNDPALRTAAGDFLDGITSGDFSGAFSQARDDLMASSTLTRQTWEQDDRNYGGEGWWIGTGGGAEFVTSDPTLTNAEVWDANQGGWTTWEDCFS